jgi:NAD(P)H dehydrogenase (quinone)
LNHLPLIRSAGSEGDGQAKATRLSTIRCETATNPYEADQYAENQEDQAMKVFLVYAHPNPHSLNAALRDHAIEVLQREGHEVRVSDLYAMQWKAVADAGDFPERDQSLPLDYVIASGEAYEDGTQSTDIADEQEKLKWADAVIFQFPLWWFGVPAILKGWFDRVFAYKFAYGYRNAGNTYRYGDGALRGKRALLSVTTGGPAIDYGPRGINGQMDQLLFPITHGTLFFPGIAVLPTFAVYGVTHFGQADVEAAKHNLEQRLVRLFTDDPIPFRPQNEGDYPDKHVLSPTITPGITGLPAHIATSAAPLQHQTASAIEAEERDLDQMLVEGEQEQLTAG